MTAPLTYQFYLDPAETVRASRLVLQRARFAWMHRFTWPLLLGLAVLSLATGHSWRDLQLLGIVALLLGSLQLLAPIIQRWQIRRSYAEMPTAREAQVFHISGAGLKMSAGTASTTIGWDVVLEARETREFFLFFFAKRRAYYLPKRAVGGAEDQRILRDSLRTALGSRAASIVQRG
jgi:hypothetical protein